MKKLLTAALLLFLAVCFAHSQERMTVKPEGFDYTKIPKTPEVYVPVSTESRIVKTTAGNYLINPNVRIVPTSGNQTEISATIWTVNPNYVFVGTNSDPGQGYYYTTNGGTTWGGGDLLPGSVAISSDPACTYSTAGTIHFNYFDNIMVSDRSTNGGANWLGRITVPAGSFDKNHNTVDNDPTSPYTGRIYVVWSNWTSTPYIVLSYSTNAGASYSAMQQIGQPLSGHYEQGCNIQTGPGGVVYCTWATVPSSLLEDHYGFTKSTNGGVNWTTPTTPLNVAGIRGYILSTSIRVNSFPSMAVDRSGGARNGYIYMTWAQRNLAPAGSDADICFAYSTNGGTSFSAAVRVNDDALNNGKQQFFPWITVDQSNGNIAIVFYDTRDNSTTDSCNTYIATSTNGGTTFTNMRVSDHSQRPAPLSGYAGGYYGDYIGIAAHNNVIWPFWMDNRNGPAQVYTSKITLGPPPPLPAHDIVTGPFLNLPSQFVINNAYSIKTKVTNGGTSNETNVPIRFFVNSSLVNTTNLTLNSGASDSVSNTWTPTVVGSYTLTYASGLSNDTNRTNDTVRTTVQVFPGPLVNLFCDDFTAGAGNWTITNNGGTCVWSVRALSSRPYTMPATASGNVFSADVDACGSGTTINSTATMNTTVNCTNISGTYAEFDNDFNLLGSDQCKMDVSTDGGSTWINKFTWIASRRSTHETQTLPEADGKANVKIRLTSIQPGWDWWWAVDNVCLKGYGFVGISHNQNNQPKEFALLQNYPNPFNPTTVISYALPKASSVKLVVYDMLGREVKILVNEYKQAGSYNVSFDASSIASGVYFYRINAGEFTNVKKMMLIK